MSSSGVNVLRYSALIFGVFYGFSHQATLSAQSKMNELNRDYRAKESLIAKAKAEYTRKTMPQTSQTAGGGIITDPMDSRFDLEAYLKLTEAGAK